MKHPFWIAGLLVVCFGSNATSQTFTLLANESTPNPAGTGAFTSFNSVHISGTTVVFQGSHGGASPYQGVFTVPISGGPLTRVVDTTVSIPGGSGLFASVAPVEFLGSKVIVQGGDSNANGSTAGIYSVSAQGGTPVVIADLNTPIPNGIGNFTGFSPRTSNVITDGKYVFNGLGPSNLGGLYIVPAAGGAISRIVDTTAIAPNTGTPFTSFASNSRAGGNVAFTASSGGNLNIYAIPETGGTIRTIIDNSTPIPNGTGNFEMANLPSLSGNRIVFRGTSNAGGTAQAGLYSTTIDGGPIIRLADLNTAAPGLNANFTEFTGRMTSGTNVLFTGFVDINKGGVFLVSMDGGPITKIIATGDVLDGRVVLGVTGRDIDGSFAAFSVRFTDGTDAVYSFTPVPEPAWILGIVAIGIGVRQMKHHFQRVS